MHFMFYFSLFLICVSQYSLQKVNVKELTGKFEKLSQGGEQLTDENRRPTNGRQRDFESQRLFGHSSMDSQKLGSKYNDIKETLTNYMKNGK
ncbi:Hypothetical protein SRAE_X000055800 [Strongyloides ratti]|uniref:Uncharacterized protein n=1 Tax=Strongyloides ratti TaxID=34506 RepID=A0A090LND3_STRRB|nr:Hypothetical protein SRAE_X000055800 [Strongyloides ratti]CEF71231.2 Hypothetical protein SRAE_X000055800 [Strongyloides ratti]